jgi:hypothetical protein
MDKRDKMLTAVFRDRIAATQAYEWLQDRGYHSREINVLMSDSTRAALDANSPESRIKAGSMATEGIAAGGAIGTAVGATLGAIAALGTNVAVPGLGLIIAGPILAGLAGGGAGAVAGGIIGALVGLGIPESNARAYEQALRDGGVVIGVVPRSSEDAKAIRAYFEEQDADNIVSA